jgi:hypothetical protein
MMGTVSGFNVVSESTSNAKLVYQNFDSDVSARGGDQYELYPTWFIPLGFG